MPSTGASPRDELFAYEPRDAGVAQALADAWAMLTPLPSLGALDALTLCVVHPDHASPGLLASPYYTASLQAMRSESLIVVNESFVLELEAAIRAFGTSESLLGCPHLQSDGHLFGVVRRIEADAPRALARFRKLANGGAAGEADVRLELALVLLFFLGHELGHLLAGHARGQYAAFVDPDLPLEDRIDDAVVKLCRHVDEFAPTQFGLPGFEQAADPASDVRQAADAYRARNESRYLRQEAFFDGEEQADDWANRIVVEHLARVGELDPVDAERRLYRLARGVFVAGLYTWYRDLAAFAAKLGVPRMEHARQLGGALIGGRERYVHAASLFGEYHRFTLLRAALALEAVMRARTDWFARPKEGRSIWCRRSATDVQAGGDARREWWLSESLQRYTTLCIAMDTAVKIAYVGCSTAWMVRTDRRRGTPQLLVMEYEGIEQVMARLRRIA